MNNREPYNLLYRFKNDDTHFLHTGHTENIEIGFEGSATSFGAIAQAFYGIMIIMFAY